MDFNRNAPKAFKILYTGAHSRKNKSELAIRSAHRKSVYRVHHAYTSCPEQIIHSLHIIALRLIVLYCTES